MTPTRPDDPAGPDAAVQLRQTQRKLTRASEAARAARGRARAYRGHLARLLGALGYPADDLLAGEPPTRPEIRPAVTAALSQRVASELVEQIATGTPLAEAAVGVVRELMLVHPRRARSLAQALWASEELHGAGSIALALMARGEGLFDVASRQVAGLPEELPWLTMPVEHVDLAFRRDPAAGRALCARFLAGDLASISDTARLRLAQVAFAHHAFDHAAALLEGEEGNAATWLRRSAERAITAPRRVSAPDDGVLRLGVLTYGHPDWDHASTNVGDHVQTLAMLGHLVRHDGLTFEGGPLADFATALQKRVRSDRRSPCAARTVELIPIDRDFSSIAEVPDGTWAIFFGWFAQPVFDVFHDLPPHPGIEPIYVSFHVIRPELLTESMVEHLRKHAPVGCRDWSTVALLQGRGIDAFFSGCLTTTVDTLFAERPTAEAARGGLVVDLVRSQQRKGEYEGWPRATQLRPEQRADDPASNLAAADAGLRRLHQEVDELATSRLHAYLPATALGVDVDFRPQRITDVRFDGLLGLEPGCDELRAMQAGLLDKLHVIMTALSEGAAPDDVRARWREACAPDVAHAEARRARARDLVLPRPDLEVVCSDVRARAATLGSDPRGTGETVNIAVSLDAAYLEHLPVVLESIVGTTGRPLSVSATTRGLTPSDVAPIAALFPDLQLTLLPCDDVDLGEVRGMVRHIDSLAVVDRLLLPLLLPELKRCVFLDLDLLVLEDVGGLADIDLGGLAIAARPSTTIGKSRCFDHVRHAARRLDDPAIASELRARMHARWDGNPPAFNAGVLVLDLERLRNDDFCRNFVPFVERYGLNDQELLCCYAGPEFVALDPAWNLWPKADMTVEGAKIVHWAGPGKPWLPDYVIGREHWRRCENHLAARRARAVVSM